MNPKRIIFLDCDGVLNRNSMSESLIEAECLQNLKYLVDKTRAEIVVSSTWRKSASDLRVLADHFQHAGIPIWIDTTTVIRNAWHSTDRVLEILTWLAGKDYIENWIALDDESNWALYPRNFRTRGWTGLTREIAEAAADFLLLNAQQVSTLVQKSNQHYHEHGTLPAALFNGKMIPLAWPTPALPSVFDNPPVRDLND